MIISGTKNLSLKNFFVYPVALAVLLLSNVVGFRENVYFVLDSALNPFVIWIRNYGLNQDVFLKEVTQKSSVLKENIELRRELSSYEELKAQNTELQNQVAKLESQTNITVQGSPRFYLGKVIGVQNIYSMYPEIQIYKDNNDLKLTKFQPVYYGKNTLFGFVLSTEGRVVTVAPYYSPTVDFKIPVQNSRDKKQRGFVSNIEGGIITIKNIPKEDTVSEGDAWITTNDVSQVPSDLIVGKVSKVVQNEKDGFQEVQLELPFNSSKLEYVLFTQ